METITMNELVSISQFISTKANEEMPIKLAYKFNKLLNDIQSDIKFFQQKYQEIIKPYVKEDNTIDTSKINEYNPKIEELANTEVNKPNITFKIEELECLHSTITELRPIMCLIEE